jgi:hypothetical protein
MTPSNTDRVMLLDAAVLRINEALALIDKADPDGLTPRISEPYGHLCHARDAAMTAADWYEHNP